MFVAERASAVCMFVAERASAVCMFVAERASVVCFLAQKIKRILVCESEEQNLNPILPDCIFYCISKKIDLRISMYIVDKEEHLITSLDNRWKN